MALSGKSGRQGSAEKPFVIPHTRIEEESHLQEYYDIGGPLCTYCFIRYIFCAVPENWGFIVFDRGLAPCYFLYFITESINCYNYRNYFACQSDAKSFVKVLN